MREQCIAEQTKPTPVIKTEQPGIVYGREFLPVVPMDSWIPSEEVLTVLNALNGPDTESKTLRNIVTFDMNNNTALNRKPLSFERPVSAYFTYKPADVQMEGDQPHDEESVVIEWGVIDPKSNVAKLHNVLNNSIPGLRERPKNGMKLSSGHIAKLTDVSGYIALFDDLGTQKGPIEKRSPMGKMINTLYAHGIIPIDGKGQVVFPAFYDDEATSKQPTGVINVFDATTLN